jgi:hypothetical protein
VGIHAQDAAGWDDGAVGLLPTGRARVARQDLRDRRHTVQIENVLGEVRALLTLGIDPDEAKRRAAGLPADWQPAAVPPTVEAPYTFGAWLEEFKPIYLRYRRAGAKHKTTVLAYIQAQSGGS